MVKNIKPSIQREKGKTKHNSRKLDSRQASNAFSSRRSRISRSCNCCKEKGTLLPCTICSQAYHLTCLGVSELDVSFLHWVCISCADNFEKRLIEEDTRLVKAQAAEKESWGKKLYQKLMRTEADTLMKRFKNKHPDLVKGGKIAYPIDDTLIWKSPELHEVEENDPPLPKAYNINPEILGEILFICDFLFTYKELLQVPKVGIDVLYNALNTQHENKIVKDLHIGLLRPLVAKMIKKDNIDKKMSRGLSYLLCRAQKIANLEDIMDTSYLILLESIFSSGLWNEFTEDSEPFTQKFELFPLSICYYEKYTLQEKIQMIALLISMLLDSIQFYQEITKRMEKIEILRKEKHDIHMQLKTLQKGNKVSLASTEVSNINDRLEKVLLEMKDIRTRSECIGKDRHYNEYYVFPWERKLLFVKRYKPIEGKGKESETGYWYYYNTKEEVELLKKWLCDKGIRETKLSLGLEKYLFELTPHTNGEGESTSSEGDLGETEKEGKLENSAYKLEDLKQKMKEAYTATLNTLGIGNSEVMDQIDAANNADQLKEAFISLSNCTGSKPIEAVSEDLPIKKAKVEIFIWEDYGDLFQFYSQYLSGVEQFQELFLCFHIFAAVLYRYLEAHQPEIPPEETSYSIARRSYRLERLRKLQQIEDEFRNQEQVCYVCGEAGLIICCDGCPKVAHQACAGLDEIPDGDWFCSECVMKAETMRVTRHRARLTKCRN
ncbi:unnamed protein product [Blepharisma stoltei]|uniref:PHD-type domain-containing protein n=1 Tax=Blepharisma stoltei TaxID=1481888 RepID=A0AAU9IAE5_9CILI|nr:unnamed protein product [Blepharisma stoltei]